MKPFSEGEPGSLGYISTYHHHVPKWLSPKPLIEPLTPMWLLWMIQSQTFRRRKHVTLKTKRGARRCAYGEAAIKDVFKENVMNPKPNLIGSMYGVYRYSSLMDPMGEWNDTHFLNFHGGRKYSGCTDTWNPKQPFINGCFSWMIPNLYIENCCFTKHLFINGCLGFQVEECPNKLVNG